MQTNRAIADRFGISSKTVERLNAKGRELGDLPPWEGGPDALTDWHDKHGRELPSWLLDAYVMELMAKEKAGAQAA